MTALGAFSFQALRDKLSTHLFVPPVQSASLGFFLNQFQQPIK